MNALSHAFCLLEREGEETLALDGRGFRLLSEMIEEYAFEIDFDQVEGDAAKELLETWMAQGLLHGYEPGEELALQRYAEQLKAHGVLTPRLLTEEEMDDLEWKQSQPPAKSGRVESPEESPSP